MKINHLKVFASDLNYSLTIKQQIMPFNNFNGVTQTTANSCGAFALAAALNDLGYLVIPPLDRLDTANLANRYNVPSQTAASVAAALKLYQVSGNLVMNAAVPNATYQYQNPVADTNPPSALVFLAHQNGVPVASVMTSYDANAAAMFGAFAVTNVGAAGNLLVTETALILGPPAYGGVVGPIAYPGPPAAPGTIHILSVNNGAHWIAINDTQVYDSGTGFVGAYVYNVGPPAQITYAPPGVPPVVHQLDGLWITLT